MPTVYLSINVRKRILDILVYLLLALGSIIYILPFLWQVSTSLKIPSQLFVFPPKWIPNPVAWENYPRGLRMVPFGRYFWNSTIVTSLSVIGRLVSCPIVAYSFARLKWPGRDFFFVATLATLMIPFQVTMIPLFITFRKLGWIDTFKPLIIPCFFGSAFFIFLLRQFFLTIPEELSDAAKIDGCSHFGIFWRIMLPLTKPALAVVAIFEFLWTWNDFIGPLIFLNSEEKYTVAIGLQQFFGAHGADWGALMATSTVVTFPVILLFFFTQRYFIEGITLTGIKA